MPLQPIDLDDQQPTSLTEQIYQCLQRSVAAGDLVGGEALPSVRTLAAVWGVSTLTVQNALTKATRSGLLQSRRGRERIVHPQAAAAVDAATLIAADAERIVRYASDLGLTRADLRTAIDTAWRQRDRASRRLSGSAR